MFLALHPNTFMARLLGREDRAAATPPGVTRLLAVAVRDGATRELPRMPHGRMVVQDEVASGALKGCKPQLCYIDDIKSWSTNELTINWNSSLSWVASFAADKT